MRLVISSVSVPSKPGSTKPAVAWTIRPRRPRLDLPSIRATTSSGSRPTRACARARTRPGGSRTARPSPISTSSVSRAGGSSRSIAAARWLWKTRKEAPRRRSTDAGCTSAGVPRARSRSGPRRPGGGSCRPRARRWAATRAVVCQPGRLRRPGALGSRADAPPARVRLHRRGRRALQDPFYVMGGALAVWAVLVSSVGIARHATFPPGRGLATPCC